MKIQFWTKHLLRILCLVFSLIFVGTSQAALEQSVICKTSFGEKTFIISENNVTFEKRNSSVGRSISSVTNVKTEYRQMGFDKILYIQGLKYRIHINNLNDFNEIDDYVVISSPKGHDVTFPLNCHHP